MNVRSTEVEVLPPGPEDCSIAPIAFTTRPTVATAISQPPGTSGVWKPACRSDEDDQRDHDQRHRVEQSGQDLRPPETETAVRRRGPSREHDGSRRHGQRHHIRQVVAGVGEQDRLPARIAAMTSTSVYAALRASAINSDLKGLSGRTWR